jgi:hypothetical protein
LLELETARRQTRFYPAKLQNAVNKILEMTTLQSRLNYGASTI